jgi:Tfp pilus assembly protein PilE
MRVVRGFTIVEFAIAISVAVILGMAGITRYNSYLREQDFTNGGQQVASCLQNAYLQARTGLGNSRYTRATITSDANAVQVSCIVEVHPLLTSNGTQRTVTQLLGGTPAEGTGATLYRGDNTQLTSGTITRVVFGALEGGAPLGLSSGATILRQPDTSGVGTYIPFGRGFTMDATSNAILLHDEDTTHCGFISMTAVGSPIQFQTLTTCP